MRRQRKPSEIPEFKDEMEAAEFWDTHSPEDFPDEFEEVEVQWGDPLIEMEIGIKLDRETITEMSRLARERGVSLTALGRVFILEHLHELKSRSSHSSHR